MFRFLKAHYLVTGIALVTIGFVALLIVRTINNDPYADLIITTVETGDVTEVVSVSGVIKAFNTAELAFPATGGVVREVLVQEGSQVQKGDVLASLASANLLADRRDALAALRLAEADYNELLAGPRSEARVVTDQTLAAAESNLERTIQNQAEAVTSARRTYLSSSLSALAVDSREDATAPTITGTYNCENEGKYTIEFYPSSAQSGYSYKLSGLESETTSAYETQPGPLGSCGLLMQIDDNSTYGKSVWEISVPNTQGALYIQNKNALAIAEETAKTQITTAENALAVAKAEANLANADPRSEAVIKTQARMGQARARLENIDASIADRSIFAPFAGTVTSIDILAGESATSLPIITILATDTYEIEARIPEIDITKLNEGDQATIIFDARSAEPQSGSITYISPLPQEIDGVAYFEAKLKLDQEPDWLRSGLNADVDIVTSKIENTTRVPKRFIQESKDGSTFVEVIENNKIQTTSVEILFSGNDGYTAVSGVNEGTRVVAP